MHRKSTRREFLKRSSLAGAGDWITGGTSGWAKSKSPGEVIRFACIAVGGKGRSDSEDAQAHGDVVAICDIDEKRLDHAADKFPRARKYRDYRKMLGEMEKSIDAVTVIWYDGGRLPTARLLNGRKVPSSGMLILGEDGTLFGHQFLSGDALPEPRDAPPESPGHFTEFAGAITGGRPPMSNFQDYAGPLTETVLLGNLAVWAGKKIEWDAENMSAKNAPELDAMIHRRYREGWTL